MKIRFKIDMVFDNNEAWNNIDELQSAFVEFLTAQNLVGEKIFGAETLEPNSLELYITKSPSDIVSVKKAATIKQQIQRVSTTRNEKGQYEK